MTNETSHADFLRIVLKSQYHAALAMLQQALVQCPEDLWYSKDQTNAFWQTAYHTLYFTHLYLQTDELAFKPWKHHQAAVQHEDAIAGRPDPNSKLPLIPDPYSREQVLEYWSFCDAMVDPAVDALDPLSPQSGWTNIWLRGRRCMARMKNVCCRDPFRMP